MKKPSHTRFLLLIALTLSLLLSYSPLTLAQKDGETRRQGRSQQRKSRTVYLGPQPGRIEEGGEQFKGERGTTMRAAQMNFASLARKEALNPPMKPPKNYKDADGPEPDFDNLPVPINATITGKDGDDAVNKIPARGGEQGGPLVPSPAPLSSFQALPDGLSSIPPDTHGAVGPNHLMTTLNTQIRIQNRAGGTISTVTLDSFWAALGNPDTFDPKILYDPFNGRWIFTAVANGDSPASSILIGASATSDPTGNWFLYRVDADSTDQRWADYPSFGFNKDWLVVHVNMFPLSSGAERTKVYAFSKASVYAGGPTASFTSFDRAVDASFNLTMVPAITYDNTLSTLYLVSRWSSAQGLLRIFTITGPVGNETLTATGLFPASPIPWSSQTNGTGDFGQQAGSNHKVNNGDTRMQQVVYRNGSLWCVHHIFLPGGEAPSRTAVQWWQIDPNSGAVQQRATIDDNSGTTSYAYPSIAVNRNNDVLIGYSRYSATQFVSSNYSFRAGTDPLNSLRQDTVLKLGEGPYFKKFSGSRNRWGDYSNTVVDPVNDVDMWTVQQYVATPAAGCVIPSNPPPPPAPQSICSRWATWWGRVTADGTPPGPAPNAPTNPTPPPAPANNNFANAQAITGCAGSITGTNLSATREAGEPNHDGNPGGKSVWYTWQAPSSGTVTFDTRGNSYDTLIAVYTGTSVNNLGAALASNDDAIAGSANDLSSAVTFPVNGGQTYRIAVDGFFSNNPPPPITASGYHTLNWAMVSCQGAPASTFQFSSANYAALEGAHFALITVYRHGNTASAATVDFTTTDSSAIQRTDYTTALGTLSFAAGETSKTFPIVITDDAYVEGDETISLALSNPTGGVALANPNTASITLVENDTFTATTNPIDDARFFVRQTYADFLNREPDQGGLDYWTGQIAQCGTNVNCINFQRSAVSAAFFIELEFQSTGSFVYRVFKASYGVRPTFVQFTPDRARLVDTANLEQNKTNYTQLFVQRPEFTARYPLSLDGPAFVDALLQTLQQSTGLNLTGQRDALIAAFNNAGGGTNGRAAVLRNVADNPTFVQDRAEYNRAFVLMQYFGFLKREVDEGGYQFWLNVVNNSVPNDPSGYRSMVCAFITSPEYQQRFSAVVTRNDTVCAPQ